MPVLTQQKHPMLWNLFQYLIGGTIDKRRLCLNKFSGTGRVLEVGCSVGNIARAFTKYPEVRYTGIDIDPGAIAYASSRFARYRNFDFLCEELGAFAKKGLRFDYIMFAGCLHHIDDRECLEMLTEAVPMLDEGGTIVIVDPLLPRPDDPWLLHRYIKLEQGGHLRTGDEMLRLIGRLDGIGMPASDECIIGATPIGKPLCARFGVYTLSRGPCR
jgi:SAM-dependent methyltransferase